MKRTWIAAALVLAGCGTQDLSQQLVGHWVSASCEAYPNGMGGMNHLERDFTLSAPGSWKLTVTLFADPACATPFLALDLGGGPFHVGAASAHVSGATEVDYDFAYRKVKPLSAAGATTLDQSGCGNGQWMTNEEQDVTTTGCAALGLPKLADCPTEHDLNQIVGNQLFYGDRSGDLCTARPTMLGAFAVARQ